MIRRASLAVLAVAITACGGGGGGGGGGADGITGEGVFATSAGTDIIEGELFLPEGDGPFPAMIIVPGSGNEPREALEPFAALLNGNGYGLYIYDKRGVGNSTGTYPAETLEDPLDFLMARAEDILGIVELLEIHDQIDPNRIGLFGSSQGAWVNSLVYDQVGSLAYIVMSSGGVAPTGVERYYDDLTDDENLSIEEAMELLGDYDGVMGFDPLPIIRDMDIPVLWIYGYEDRSHPVRYDIPVLDEFDKSNFTVEIFQNTDHELLDLDTGQPPPDLFDKVGAWLVTNN